MRHVCLCLFLCSALSVFAQDAVSRVEVFGGYSYLHIDTQGVSGSTLDSACNNFFGAGTCPPGSFGVHPGANGWTASVQYNPARFLGIKADFSGHYNTPITVSSQIANALAQAGITGLPPKAHTYSYLFGPVVFKVEDGTSRLPMLYSGRTTSAPISRTLRLAALRFLV